MIAWTVLSILALLPLCFAKPALRKSHTELFRCNLKYISMVQAQEAVKLGCNQMEVAPPASLFPASFSGSELFGLVGVGLFTWPVFPSKNVLREDYGLNRVVFDSSCRLVGLIHIKPTGPECCLHLMEIEDLKMTHELKVYDTRWDSLQLYGYRFDDELYLKNSVEEFVKFNFQSFRRNPSIKNALSMYPNLEQFTKFEIRTRPIELGPNGIQQAAVRFNRRLIINSNKEIIGICRKSDNVWKPFAELRILNDVYKLKVISARGPERGYEGLHGMNHNGIQVSTAMLRSHLLMACKVLMERNMGTNTNDENSMLAKMESTSDRLIFTWPLRMPENFVHGM
ncbi:CSEP0234 putative effector protein [Blumeria hordei DH14]|uniref:CSEP0234 putative effector protein n=1 Tax=Blumeria graminis f. sp. hordei (strain DH14) TaxID=546991 RepID=N1JD79_BLUG1|nr:CSEP0234 putative effector protein [Blumeria hordei DH14]